MYNFFYCPPLYSNRPGSPFRGGQKFTTSENYPRNFHAIRPSGHKKILPPEKKAGNFFRSWSGDLEGRLRLAASCSRGPRHLGQHGAGLLAGAGVDVVVAEEDLRGRSAGGAVLGHVVRTDVDGLGGGLFHELDAGCLGMGAGHTVGLTFGGLNHEVDAAVIGEGLVQLEGEGLTLAYEVVR